MTDFRREAESRLIYVCTRDGFYVEEPGECPGWDWPPHRLRKRRAIVCSECTQSYYKYLDFKKHECGDAL